MKKLLIGMLVIGIVFASFAQVRVKDVSKIQGLHDTQLVGYGLVVGLEGTGDGLRTMFTVQSVLNMLKNLGIEVPTSRIRVKNVAAVMITTTLKPFVKKGSRIDITVSSLGDAKSLEGGTLLMSPLQDSRGNIYAAAQGPISTGGYHRQGDAYNLRKKNHVAVGVIPSGAIVEKEIKTNELSRDYIKLELLHPDFSSAVELAKAINKSLNTTAAQPEDAATIAVGVPLDAQEGAAFFEFIAKIEQTTFMPDRVARVVVNEKTGTIVAGGNVTISQVAVSHGGITVEVESQRNVSQPAPLSQGYTAIVPQVQQQVEEEKTRMVVLGPTTNVSDLAKALNDLGVSAKDVIAIFQSIKKAGALQAELMVI